MTFLSPSNQSCVENFAPNKTVASKAIKEAKSLYALKGSTKAIEYLEEKQNTISQGNSQKIDWEEYDFLGIQILALKSKKSVSA